MAAAAPLRSRHRRTPACAATGPPHDQFRALPGWARPRGGSLSVLARPVPSCLDKPAHSAIVIDPTGTRRSPARISGSAFFRHTPRIVVHWCGWGNWGALFAPTRIPVNSTSSRPPSFLTVVRRPVRAADVLEGCVTIWDLGCLQARRANVQLQFSPRGSGRARGLSP